MTAIYVDTLAAHSSCMWGLNAKWLVRPSICNIYIEREIKIYIYLCIFLGIYMYIYIYMYLNLHIYIYISINRYIYIYKYKQIHTYIYTVYKYMYKMQVYEFYSNFGRVFHFSHICFQTFLAQLIVTTVIPGWCDFSVRYPKSRCRCHGGGCSQDRDIFRGIC